jgi:hypothetical protein
VFVKVLFSTLCMLALAQGDEAIVVVDDTSACLDEAALRTELPPLPTGSVLSVVVVGHLAGDTHTAAVELQRHDDPAPLSRVLHVDRGACPSLAPIVARVVARHLEALPTSTWPGAVVVENDDVDDDDDDVDDVDDDVELARPALPVTDVGAGGSVVGGVGGFQRVSLHAVARRLVPVVDGDQPLWLGGDVFARAGGLLPVAVDAGRVVGGDLVGGVAARAMWSRWSATLGVEGGVLAAQGVGYGVDAVAFGPTVNAVTSVGVSFAPLWVDLVVRVPLVRATFTGPSSSVTETPVYVGVAVGGFVVVGP